MAKSISIPITGSAAPLRKVFGEVENDLKTFGGKVGDAFKKMGTVAAVAGAAIGGAAIAFGKSAVDSASDLAEATSKAATIFGSASDDVLKFADNAATTLGQTKQEAIDAASTFAIFGKAAGLAGDDLYGFSTDFVGLASDLASFNNTTPEDAVNAIGAALRGESEPLRRYGILLDDATLKAEALKLGIYDGEGALTAQQKTLAAEQAIYRQAGDAQGDFARTSKGLANQTRILKAQMGNLTAEVGERLLPIALKLVSFFADKVMPVIEKVTDAFSQDGLAGVFRLVADTFRSEGPRIASAAQDLLVRLGQWVLNTGLPYLVDKLQALGAALVDWIGPRIRPMLEALGGFIADGANWLVQTGLPMFVDKIKQLGDALVDWIKPRIQPAIVELRNLIGRVVAWLVTDGVPALLRAADGLAGALIGWVKTIAPEVLKGLGTLIGQLASWVWNTGIPKLLELGKNLGSNMIDGLVDGLGKVLSGASNVAKSVVNAIIRFINRNIIDKINDLLEFKISVPLGPDINVNPPDIPGIPMLAKGGIVTKPTLAMIGEAGPEAVVPLSGPNAPGMGGATINVYMPAGADGDEVVRALQNYVRRNGTLPLATTGTVRQ